MENISTFPNTCFKYTNNALDTNKDICQIIKNLDHSKAHDHNMISIRMLKLCGISICKPLEVIFENSLSSANFLPNVKKQMLFPYLKKKINNA